MIDILDNINTDASSYSSRDQAQEYAVASPSPAWLELISRRLFNITSGRTDAFLELSANFNPLEGGAPISSS